MLVVRGHPSGGEAWTRLAATKLGLESRLRPPKDREKVECPFSSPNDRPLTHHWLTASLEFRMAEKSGTHSADDFEEVAIRFLRSFEIVFHYDWTYTTMMLGCFDCWHSKDGDGITLLQTGWEDNDNEVKCLSAMLDNYRRFVHVLKARGLEPTVSNPPPDSWNLDRCDWPKPWRCVDAE